VNGLYAGGVNEQRDGVLVVGAGIIGLTSAFRLLQAGHAVTILDPLPARGATWAAAGMIAPSAEIAPGEETNYQRQLKALPAWRDLAEELEKLTHERLSIVQRGTLLVGWDASDRRLVDQFVQVARGFGAPFEVRSRDASPNEFYGLSPRINEGVHLDGDAWIDPDQVVRVLLVALDLLGAKVVNAEVTSVASSANEVRASSSSGEFRARYGIIATGSAGLPPGLISNAHNAVRPVRGVTIRVQGLDRSDVATVRAFVRGRAFYMVSRPGGYCVLGATAEERSDAVLEVGELAHLLRDALDVVPALESAHVLEHRIGLRPASPNLEPFFEVLGETGWAWVSGHYRHGVTLAPLTANDALGFVKEAP
jgi:glycine oxidase